jgi:hypothetical protein
MERVVVVDVVVDQRFIERDVVYESASGAEGELHRSLPRGSGLTALCIAEGDDLAFHGAAVDIDGSSVDDVYGRLELTGTEPVLRDEDGAHLTATRARDAMNPTMTISTGTGPTAEDEW